jgi:pseudaminic acid biosynthesis-associated methylase
VSTDTTDFWKGDFGDAYTKRNRVDWRARIPFWSEIIDKTGARSVYEVGCNAGWNLSAIKIASNNRFIRVSGEDVNRDALDQADSAGLVVTLADQEAIRQPPYELVFTAGVLIHIAPQDLQAFMQRIVDASCDYVLAVEYEDDTETEVEYRGHSGKLWKRPYGKLYQEMGLTLVEEGDPGTAFDRCKYWLLRR